MKGYLRFKRFFLVAAFVTLVHNGNSLAADSGALVSVFNLILGSDAASSSPLPPRRRDFGGNAVFSPVTNNLTSRSVGSARITYQYDQINRISGFSANDPGDPTSDLSVTFTYQSLTTERLQRIDIVSFTELGTQLNGRINFAYATADQLSNLTNASFENVVITDASDEQIFTSNISYDPSYENDRLVQIRKEVNSNLPPPLNGTGNTTIILNYNGNTVIETIETTEQGGQSIGRRVNLSAFRQEVTRQLLDGSGDILFSTTEIANYETKACNQSNRLLEKNLLILNLFFVPSVNAFFEPELCRD